MEKCLENFKKVAGPFLDPILFPLESRREKYGDFPPVLRGWNDNIMGENWSLPREKWISFLGLLMSRRGGKPGLLSDLQGQNKKKKRPYVARKNVLHKVLNS